MLKDHQVRVYSDLINSFMKKDHIPHEYTLIINGGGHDNTPYFKLLEKEKENEYVVFIEETNLQLAKSIYLHCRSKTKKLYGGECHEGYYQSASSIYELIKNDLTNENIKKITFIGFSNGGSVASILATIFIKTHQKRFPDGIHACVFGTAPTFSEDLCLKTKKYITNIILENDYYPKSCDLLCLPGNVVVLDGKKGIKKLGANKRTKDSIFDTLDIKNHIFKTYYDVILLFYRYSNEKQLNMNQSLQLDGLNILQVRQKANTYDDKAFSNLKNKKDNGIQGIQNSLVQNIQNESISSNVLNDEKSQNREIIKNNVNNEKTLQNNNEDINKTSQINDQNYDKDTKNDKKFIKNLDLNENISKDANSIIQMADQNDKKQENKENLDKLHQNQSRDINQKNSITLNADMKHERTNNETINKTSHNELSPNHTNSNNNNNKKTIISSLQDQNEKNLKNQKENDKMVAQNNPNKCIKQVKNIEGKNINSLNQRIPDRKLNQNNQNLRSPTTTKNSKIECQEIHQKRNHTSKSANCSSPNIQNKRISKNNTSKQNERNRKSQNKNRIQPYQPKPFITQFKFKV